MLLPRHNSEAHSEAAVRLMPVVIAAARSLVSRYPFYSHEYDELVGEGNLTLAKLLPALVAGVIVSEPAYVYKCARRRMWRYLKRWYLTGPGVRALTDADLLFLPSRRAEPELECIHAECMEAIYSVCHDDTDREIIRLREDRHTLVETGQLVGMGKSAVCSAPESDPVQILPSFLIFQETFGRSTPLLW